MSHALEHALTVLKEGGVVCIPTESTYGLAADHRCRDALVRIAELKKRPGGVPFGLIAGSLEQARAITGEWHPRALALAERHWPGPLTLVLPPAPGLHPEILGPTGGVGIRVPGLELTRGLAEAHGHALTATSANPSGEPAATTVAEARRYFGEGVDCYLDGGACSGTPSTLVEVDGEGQLQLIRAGAIDLQDLAAD